MKSFATLAAVCARYGAIAGFLGTALLVILFYRGHHPFLIPPFLDFRIILFSIFILFSLKEYRNVYSGGVLSFAEGMIGSFVFIVIFAVTASILLIIFTAMNENFLSSYINLSIEYVRSLPVEVVEKIGKDEVARNLSELPKTNMAKLV